MAAIRSSTPTREAMETLLLMTEANIPNSATIAKLRTPTSLFDHSRSIPTSIPMPMATPIFNAIGVAGKCVESICITNLISEREAPATNSQLPDRNDDMHTMNTTVLFLLKYSYLIKDTMHENLAIAKYPSKLLFHA